MAGIRRRKEHLMTDLFDLTGRRALVTGSSRGIGFTSAHALARAGAHVVVHGRNPDGVERARTALAEEFGADRISGIAFDITDENAVNTAIDHLESSGQTLDILVNNAGVQHRVPLVDLALDDWRRVIDTNLTSAFLVGRAAARHMLPRGRGKIVNICSIQTDLARPTISAYTAAKGGLRNLTRAMTAEWARSGLQINGIAPGYIHTEMTQALVDDPEFNQWIIGRTPSNRWGTPADLAGPIVWLASAGSDYVNGQVVFVDGGMSVVV